MFMIYVYGNGVIFILFYELHIMVMTMVHIIPHLMNSTLCLWQWFRMFWVVLNTLYDNGILWQWPMHLFILWITLYGYDNGQDLLYFMKYTLWLWQWPIFCFILWNTHYDYDNGQNIFLFLKCTLWQWHFMTIGNIFFNLWNALYDNSILWQWPI